MRSLALLLAIALSSSNYFAASAAVSPETLQPLKTRCEAAGGYYLTSRAQVAGRCRDEGNGRRAEEIAQGDLDSQLDLLGSNCNGEAYSDCGQAGLISLLPPYSNYCVATCEACAICDTPRPQPPKASPAPATFGPKY